jgi:hypothetical protein
MESAMGRVNKVFEKWAKGFIRNLGEERRRRGFHGTDVAERPIEVKLIGSILPGETVLTLHIGAKDSLNFTMRVSGVTFEEAIEKLYNMMKDEVIAFSGREVE